MFTSQEANASRPDANRFGIIFNQRPRKGRSERDRCEKGNINGTLEVIMTSALQYTI